MPEEAVSGVYSITNTVSNRVYIGVSSNVFARWASHRSKLNLGRHGNKKLQADWYEFGEEAFEFRLLEGVPYRESLREREAHYQALYVSDNEETGYNPPNSVGRGLVFGLGKTRQEHWAEFIALRARREGLDN